MAGQGIESVIVDPRAKVGEYIKGDATDEDVLHLARIEEASVFIAASHIDRDNIFAALLVRKINPDLHILARANLVESTDKLYRAGADFVFSLSTVAAQMLAEMLVGDGAVVILAEGVKVMTSPVGAPLAGKTIGQARIRTRTGATVICVFPPEGGLKTNPKSDFRLVPGSTISVMGHARQLREFKRRFEK